MTDTDDGRSDDTTTSIPFERRDILKLAGAAGGIATLGTESATAVRPKEFIVGTEHGNAGIARRKATAVKRTIDFGPDIGEAVAGRWPEQALKGLKNNPQIRYIEENGVMHAHSHLDELPWGVDRIDAEVVHDAGTTGSGIDVAILDTGIDVDHPDLQANLGDGHAEIDCTDSAHPDGSCDEDWDDDRFHGTHVAGTVGAIANDSQVIGVAHDVTLHSVKVLNQNGDGGFDDIAAGMEWAISEGHDVLNMSLGACCPDCGTVGDGTGDCDSCGGTPSAVQDAIDKAKDNDVLIITSAGNDGNRPDCDGDGDAICDDDDCVGTPANNPDTIAVSASNDTDGLANYSSVGPEVDFIAPGGSSGAFPGRAVFSTWNNGGVRGIWGTSMAAPHVSGVAALLLADGTDPTDVKTELENSVEDIGLPGVEQGAGLVDPAAAIGVDSANDLTRVQTDSPADVQYTSIELNGDLTDLTGNTGADVFFEYRESGDSIWLETPRESVSGTGTFDRTVTGLSEDTVYEFRAVVRVENTSEGWSSTRRGHVRSFSTVDNPDPLASFTHDPDVPDPGDVVSFDASGADPGEAVGVDEDDSIVRYEWNFGDGTTASTTDPEIEHTYSAPGEERVTLVVTDEFGQTHETTQTIRINEAPEAAFTHSPTVPNEGNDVEFDASTSIDPDGDIVEYAWDFGDGTTTTTTDPVTTHNYGPAGDGNWGEFDVTLTVTDNDGTSDMTDATIRVNAYPRAAFDVVTDPPVRGETVAFDASASMDPNPGGSIVEYAWDFGDGTTTTRTTPDVEHTFTTGGVHTVTLRVTDDDDASDDALSVHEESFTVQIRVEIEISPNGGGRNSINPNRKGNVSVAVLQTSSFDGPSRLDHGSVHFGDPDDVGFDTTTDPFTPEGAATPAHPSGHVEDVDGDEDADSMFHFPILDCDFESNDTAGKLVGLTTDGVPVFGSDSVTIVGGGGGGGS